MQRASGLLRAAATRVSTPAAMRLAPTALPHARSMALGREEGDDVIKAEVLASLQQMKIDMLKNYDTKQKIPEAKMQYMQQRVEEEKARYGLEFDIPIRSEVSLADLDSVEGTKIARAEIAKAKKAGLL